MKPESEPRGSGPGNKKMVTKNRAAVAFRCRALLPGGTAALRE
jgi:hypothetical protein